MNIRVPACSTIQLSILRQIKFILVHPSGNVQLALRSCNIFFNRIEAFGTFKGNLSSPCNSNLKGISPKVRKSNHLVNRVVTFLNTSPCSL